MIALLLLSVVVAVAILIFGRKLKVTYRAVLAVLAVVAINLPSLVAVVVGDRAPRGSVTVAPEVLEVRPAKEAE